MTTIHIEEELNLEKTHFQTMEEFQLYLMIYQIEKYELSDDHKKIINERIKEADKSKEPGMTYKEFKASFL